MVTEFHRIFILSFFNCGEVSALPPFAVRKNNFYVPLKYKSSSTESLKKFRLTILNGLSRGASQLWTESRRICESYKSVIEFK